MWTERLSAETERKFARIFANVLTIRVLGLRGKTGLTCFPKMEHIRGSYLSGETCTIFGDRPSRCPDFRGNFGDSLSHCRREVEIRRGIWYNFRKRGGGNTERKNFDIILPIPQAPKEREGLLWEE